MMSELEKAIKWALGQDVNDDVIGVYKITKDTPHELVDKVREYFNDKGIAYNSFSFDDLKPYL